MLSLHRCNGGEGPARTALALVLHRVYTTLFDPVHFSWKVSNRGDFGSKIITISKKPWFVVQERFPFVLGPVREFVVTNRGSFVFVIIKFGDFSVGAYELSKSELEVLQVFILLAMLGSPLKELNGHVFVSHDCGEQSACN